MKRVLFIVIVSIATALPVAALAGSTDNTSMRVHDITSGYQTVTYFGGTPSSCTPFFTGATCHLYDVNFSASYLDYVDEFRFRWSSDTSLYDYRVYYCWAFDPYDCYLYTSMDNKSTRVCGDDDYYEYCYQAYDTSLLNSPNDYQGQLAVYIDYKYTAGGSWYERQYWFY